MVEAHNSRVAAPAADEAERVAAYLTEHPDFFELRPALLESLSVPHASGNAVSLIERQVKRLKQRNRHLQKRMEVLVETAKENEDRVLRLNRLARALIGAGSLQAVVAALGERLRSDFGVTESLVALRAEALQVSLREAVAGVRVVDAGSGLPRALNNAFRTGRCECTALSNDALRAFLFPDATAELRSLALIPLERNAAVGVLALASDDGDHFSPHMGTWFLEQLGYLVSGALMARLGDKADATA